MQGLKVELLPKYGRALVADAAFNPGDYLVCEEPMLAVNSTVGEQEGAFMAKCLQAFIKAPQEVQAKVLELFCPDLQEFANDPVVKSAQAFVDALPQAEALPSVPTADLQQIKALDTTTALHVLLAWQMNAHLFGHQKALFHVGSKLTHVCFDSNSAYKSWSGDDDDGALPLRGTHIATKPIQPGDLITTSYLGWDDSMLMSTPMRRKLLYDKKLFHCDCTGCTAQPDYYRAMLCPVCTAEPTVSEQLLEAVETLTSSSPRSQVPDELPEIPRSLVYVLRNPQPPPPPSDTSPATTNTITRDADISSDADTPKPWVCMSCNAEFSDARVLSDMHHRAGLVGLSANTNEAQLERHVYALNQQLDRNPVLPPGLLPRLLASCALLLGFKHWTTIRCMLIWMEFLAGDIDDILEAGIPEDDDDDDDGEPDVGDTTCTLSELMIHVWDWLESVPQRNHTRVIISYMLPALQAIVGVCKTSVFSRPMKRQMLDLAIEYGTRLRDNHLACLDPALAAFNTLTEVSGVVDQVLADAKEAYPPKKEKVNAGVEAGAA